MPCKNGTGLTLPSVCNLKIAILQMRAGEYTRPGTKYTFQEPVHNLNKKYCFRWHFCSHSLLSDPTFDEAKFPGYKERHPAWMKVLAAHSLVSKGEYDWVMWMDGDAAIIDHSVDVRFIIAQAPNTTQFIVSHDAWHTVGDGQANTGVWLIKVNKESVQMLEEWYKLPDTDTEMSKFKTGHPWEQAVFNSKIFRTYEKVIHRLPFCWLFGHPWALLDQPFIAHLAGIPNELKLQERHRYFAFWDERTVVKPPQQGH